mmetsp:Transcript_1499/g.5950  ORF Transcript_1499/g.5950 Transcript_1499/m.5950 type:complete len:311 (-) Transcript_1499:1258-2190(-)
MPPLAAVEPAALILAAAAAPAAALVVGWWPLWNPRSRSCSASSPTRRLLLFQLVVFLHRPTGPRSRIRSGRLRQRCLGLSVAMPPLAAVEPAALILAAAAAPAAALVVGWWPLWNPRSRSCSANSPTRKRPCPSESVCSRSIPQSGRRRAVEPVTSRLPPQRRRSASLRAAGGWRRRSRGAWRARLRSSRSTRSGCRNSKKRGPFCARSSNGRGLPTRSIPQSGRRRAVEPVTSRLPPQRRRSASLRAAGGWRGRSRVAWRARLRSSRSTRSECRSSKERGLFTRSGCGSWKTGCGSCKSDQGLKRVLKF